MVIELNRDNYETEVNGSDKPLLVDFLGPQMGAMPRPHVRSGGIGKGL